MVHMSAGGDDKFNETSIVVPPLLNRPFEQLAPLKDHPLNVFRMVSQRGTTEPSACLYCSSLATHRLLPCTLRRGKLVPNVIQMIDPLGQI